MKRLALVPLLAALAITVSQSPAFARRVVVVRDHPHRTVVVVRRGFPLRRAWPTVIVRRRPGIVVTSRVFLAPVIWAPRVVVLPARERLVWEDSQALSRDDDWSDVSLAVNDRGEKLYMEVVGRVQIDFAEVVFGNGESQVVDFNRGTQGSGIYSLLDFADGRRVSHVRFVARAQSEDAKLIVRMEK